ncbi:MAG: FAD-binding oxidoreductase [Rhizobiaceae bacterium]
MTDRFPSLTSETIDRFVAIVGEKYALRSKDDIEPYVTERRGLWASATPIVLRPGSVAEVSQILKLATQTGTPIVPQGGNTGLVGAQVPRRGHDEIVLSLSRLNAIREVDVSSNTITAEAGVILEDVQKAADAVDRFFPLALGAQGTCQIGGNLSSNAGGTGVLAYGNARELCMGVEVVLPNGDVLDDLRKLKKDNTGYDLKNLFVGAEGTLGVITAAVLKLFPKPRGREMAWAAMESPQAALALINRAMDMAGSSVTAFELIAQLPLQSVARHRPDVQIPVSIDWPWHVMMELSSSRSTEEAHRLAEDILTSALEDGIIGDAVVAQSLAQGQDFWLVREVLVQTQANEGASIKHDISLPISSLPDFIATAENAVQRVCPGARVGCFGHMGDGNLHYNVSRPVDGDDQAFLNLYRPMNRAVHDVVRQFKGSISAEHGIGQLKRDELLETAPPVAIDLMRRIKAAFDPAGIMNPGKVI